MPKLKKNLSLVLASDKETGVRIPQYRLFPSYRLGMLLMVGILISLNVSSYSTLHFAWVCMVNDSSANGSVYEDVGYHGDLNWDKSVQQILFSGYNIGVCIACILPGYLVDRFGAKKTAALSLFLSAVSTFLIPLLSHLDYGYVAALRVIGGIGGAAGWPIIFSVLSHWTTRAELGLALVFTATGFPIGQFATLFLSGLECRSLGWPWVYYICSIFGFVYIFVWLIFFKSDPSTAHKGFTFAGCPTPEERDYILAGRDRQQKKERKIPWKSIFTSLPVLACMIGNFSNWCCVFLVGGYSATFLKEVLQVEVGKNGLLASLPMLFFTFGRWIFGPASDKIFPQRKDISVKLFNSVCQFSNAICMIAVSFVSEDSPSVVPVAIFCLNMFLSSSSTGGYQKSIALIAPKFSGIGGSLIGTFGAFGAISLPFVVANLTPDGTAAQWSRVYYYVAAICAFAGVIFLVFGSGSVQPWALEAERYQLEVKPSAATLLELEVKDPNSENSPA